jgi:hypothetical protein
MTWIDVQFLKDAVDMLIECRRVLKFTYVFGFYLPHDTAKRELFEDHQVHFGIHPPLYYHLAFVVAQENLEKFTEHLSELSEMPLENMQRTSVINYTVRPLANECIAHIIHVLLPLGDQRITSRFMQEMLKSVEEDGLQED